MCIRDSVQVLLIGIHDDEIHAADPGLDHPVDNVVSGAAHADDFDLYDPVLKCFRHTTYPPMYPIRGKDTP